jgi:hypothetical protein
MNGEQTALYPHWMEEFGLITRFPRFDKDPIFEFIALAPACRISLHWDKKDSRIAIQCSAQCSRRLFRRVHKEKSSFNNAFRLALGKGKKNSNRAQLRRYVTETFAAALDVYIEAKYGRHASPLVNQGYRQLRAEIATKVPRKRGRKQSVDADADERRKRYRLLLQLARRLHQIATFVSTQSDSQIAEVSKLTVEDITNSPTGRRKVIYDRSADAIPREYHHWIFGGAAFREMPRTENSTDPLKAANRQLHEPRTWRPYQLALVLLMLDMSAGAISYESLRNEIRPTKNS